MERVRQLTWVVVLLAGLFSDMACQKKVKEKPEMATKSDVEAAAETTKKFFEALEDHDFEEAQTYVTLETQPILETVMTESRKQERQDGEKPTISVVIVERKPLIGKVNLRVKISVGPQVKVETLTLVPVDKEWLLVLPRKKLSLLRLVIIYQPYEVIIVKEKERKHHPHRGHAYGHHKHGRDDD